MPQFIDATGNLLDADVDALVNTMNTVGVMGKGIALEFKHAYPQNFRAYKRACDAHQVRPGMMFVFDNCTGETTERHWRNPSRIGDIVGGLEDLREWIERLRLRSLAMPPLGCGNGGLSWSDVRPLIEERLATLGSDVNIHLFVPAERARLSETPMATTRAATGDG